MDSFDRYTQLRISAILCIFLGLVSFAFANPLPTSREKFNQAREFQQDRLSLQLQNRPLQEAFSRISQVLRKNLIVDAAIQSTTTLSFQNVNAQSALEAIVKSYDLGYHLTPSHLIIVPQASSNGLDEHKQSDLRTVARIQRPIKIDQPSEKKEPRNKDRFEELQQDLDSFMPQTSSRSLKVIPPARNLNEPVEDAKAEVIQNPDDSNIEEETDKKSLSSMTRISGITGAEGSRIAIVDFRGHSMVWKEGFKVDGIYEIQSISAEKLVAKNLQTGESEELHF